jgi:hypothetical protein
MPANPNFSRENTLDFFSFMKDYYSSQSTEKSIQTINRRLNNVEGSVSTVSKDTTEIKKDIKLIKDILDSGGGGRGGGILDSVLSLAGGATAAGGAAAAAKRAMSTIRTPSSGAAATRPTAPTPAPPPAVTSGSPPASPRPAAPPSAPPPAVTSGSPPASPRPAPAVESARPPSSRAPSVGAGRVAAATAVAGAAVAAIPMIRDMIQPQPGVPSAVDRDEASRIAQDVKARYEASNADPSRRRLQATSADYTAAISKASIETGVPAEVLASMSESESGSGAALKNPKGTATGAFQFIDTTWADMLKRHGKEKGIDVSNMQISDILKNRELMDLRYNHELSAYMGAKYVQSNERQLGLKKDDPEYLGKIYMAHFLGAGGAGKVLSGKDFSQDDMKRIISANKGVFMSGGRLLIDEDNPDPKEFNKIVQSWTKNKMEEVRGRQNVRTTVEASKTQVAEASGGLMSMDTDRIIADALTPQSEKPSVSSSRLASASGTGRREPFFDRDGGTGRRENVTRIGPQEQRLDPNRQNVFGQREPFLEGDERKRQSATLYNYDDLKKQRELRAQAQQGVSSLAAANQNERKVSLTVSPEDRARSSQSEDLISRAAIQAGLRIAGRASGAVTAAEIFKEVADRYVDRSPSASATENIRQMGTNIPGPEGGVQYSLSPDQMTEYYAKRTAELTKSAIEQSQEQAQSRARTIGGALENSAEAAAGTVIMQPIVMPERVIERNTPVPTQGGDPGVPPVSPPPSSVDNFSFGLY